MIALCNFFQSYDKVQVSSSNDNAFDYASKDWSSYSQANLSPISAIPLFYGYPLTAVITSPFTIFDQCEVYFDGECIGYYDLDNIDKQKHKASYNLRLFDKSVLPEKFDFHFEEFGWLEKGTKMFLSGARVFFDSKMIIDKK